MKDIDMCTCVWHGLYIYIDGLVQGCGNSSANAVELLQPCTKPLIYEVVKKVYIEIQ